jgi:hypothetical protein
MGQPILVAQLQHDILAGEQGEGQVRRVVPAACRSCGRSSPDDQDHVGLILKLRSLEEDGGPAQDSTTTRLGASTSARDREGHRLAPRLRPSLSRRACHARPPMSHEHRLRIRTALRQQIRSRSRPLESPTQILAPGDRQGHPPPISPR